MIILYTTGCPKCNVLKQKLQLKKIEFKEVSDTDVMIEKGFMTSPMLEVDGEILDFTKAVEWVNRKESK
jgi:glutaredoxin